MLQNPNFPPGPLQGALPQAPQLMGRRGLPAPFQEPYPRSRPFRPRFYESWGLTHYRFGNPTNDRFQMQALYMKFVFWFRRTEKMDSMMKGLMGAVPSPIIFGLELPLNLCKQSHDLSHIDISYLSVTYLICHNVSTSIDRMTFRKIIYTQYNIQTVILQAKILLFDGWLDDGWFIVLYV